MFVQSPGMLRRHGFLAPLMTLLMIASAAALPGEGGRAKEEMVFDPERGTWIEVPPPQPGTEDGDLSIARQLLAEGKYDKARKSLRLWRKNYPQSERWAEGLFYSADVEVYAANAGQSANIWRSYKWYEEIVNGWAGTELADQAMRRELIVAEMFLFRKHKRPVLGGMFRVSATEEAIEMLSRIIDQHAPRTRVAEQALRMQADYHFEHGEFEDAERAYARLAREFPRGEYERLALERAADAALASFAGVDFDDAPLLEAEERYVQYQQRFPRIAETQGVPHRLDGIRQRRAEKEFSVARFYERTGQGQAAIFYYRYVADSWPETLWAEQARARLISLGAMERPAGEILE
jgi:outer membrane assembly lipoprotein YfiO